ncbi:MAG: hypothetical protein JW838_06130 [Spirochaetes bacterium]|nr:hypothetical protein [Spirochaetota bacterium]
MKTKNLLQKIESLEKKVESLEQPKPGLMHQYLIKAFMKTPMIAGVAIAMAITSFVIYAGTVSKPYNFTDSTTISASQVNSDFNILYSLVNGNLDNNNISSLSASKLTSGKVDPARNSAPIFWSGGCSSDNTTVKVWQTYCLDIMEYDNAGEYFSAVSDGTINIKTDGYYHIISNGMAYGMGGSQSRVVKNGGTIYTSYKTSTSNVWQFHNINFVHHLRAGDTIHVEYYLDSGSYNYHRYETSGYYSRVQLMYLGEI